MVDADKKYALEYEHAGDRWALNFYAQDAEDAAAKLRNLKETVVLLGEVLSTAPANFTAELRR